MKTLAGPLQRILALAALLPVSGVLSARAQGLPSEPLVFAGGRVTIGGDLSLTTSCAESAGPGSCGDDTGFFNYSDYEHSTLRMFRLNFSASVRASQHLAILTEVRSETGSGPKPYALYVRLRPWSDRPFDIQAGRVPPTFGAFARRTYANDNLLIGYPLAYQYLISLRPDAVPANAEEVLRMRGRGWLSNFSLGSGTADKGVPLVSAFRWDTGVQVHSAIRWADLAASVTTGSLANPLVADDNGGRQVAGRVALHPQAGIVVGVSGARGPFLTNAAARAAEAVGSIDNHRAYTQSAVGVDAEYSRDYYLVRVETIRSTWRMPTIADPLTALATSVEGRYKVHPRFYAAARLDHLGFNTISSPTRTLTWEAPVTRLEVGGGYLLLRNLQLKVSAQRNTRQGGRVTHLKFGAVQAVWWF